MTSENITVVTVKNSLLRQDVMLMIKYTDVLVK
jgi:hypothetical protein